MEATESQKLLNEIGLCLMQDMNYPFQPTLLYAELGDYWVGESIFKDLGSESLYRRPVHERLPYALLDLWQVQEGNYWWTEMEYVLRDGRFEVAYFYPDEIGPEEDVCERRKRSLHRHFGTKLIVYPPLLDDDETPTYEM